MFAALTTPQRGPANILIEASRAECPCGLWAIPITLFTVTRLRRELS
jgi:hypothetical protein